MTVSLVVIALMLATASLAGAERGYVFVGGTFYGAAVPMDPVVALEYRVTDRLTVSPVFYPQLNEYDLSVRYGDHRGVYGTVVLNQSGLTAWEVGSYFGNELSEQLRYRAWLGLFGSPQGWVTPDAGVDLQYDLGGPLSIMGSVSAGRAQVGLGFSY